MMQGGSITGQDGSGDDLGMFMNDGLITVKGDVGQRIGNGMTGGIDRRPRRCWKQRRMWHERRHGHHRRTLSNTSSRNATSSFDLKGVEGH